VGDPGDEADFESGFAFFDAVLVGGFFFFLMGSPRRGVSF
jgi:hypothetical protein